MLASNISRQHYNTLFLKPIHSRFMFYPSISGFFLGYRTSIINTITDDKFESVLGDCLQSDSVPLAMSTELHTTNQVLHMLLQFAELIHTRFICNCNVIISSNMLEAR